MVFDENMLIPKEDVIVNQRLELYRNKILPYIDVFKNSIEYGNGKTEIKIKDLKNLMGEEFKDKEMTSFYSMIKTILIESGISVKLHHWYGANVILSFAKEDEIRPSIEIVRERTLKTAKNAGFLNWTEYRRRLKSYIKARGAYTEDGNGKFYSVNIGRRFIVSILFPGCIINEKSIDRYSLDGYDWVTSDGLKVKHVICHLKHSVDKEGFERDSFQWGIYKNNVADIFVLTGWENGDDLELIKGWIFDKEEVVNGRKFWDRESFLISTHDRSINKYSKYEVDNDNLELIRNKILVDQKIEQEIIIIDDETIG